MSKIKINDIDNNIAIASVDGKWGHVDGDGNVITEFIYDGAWYYNCGLAKVKKGNKYGYVNLQGELVIPIIYDMGWSFVNGIAGVKKDKPKSLQYSGFVVNKKKETYKFFSRRRRKKKFDQKSQ